MSFSTHINSLSPNRSIKPIPKFVFMLTTKKQPETIDEYIAAFPQNIQNLLHQVRNAIQKAAPGADETTKYGIPTFILNGNLVHFGGFKNHIGFYPAPRGLEAFKKELSNFKGAKGSVQFPLDKPLPIALIIKIVKYRVRQNSEKAKAKKKQSI